MRSLFPHPWGWASVAPVACAIHCAATPLLIAVAPAFAVGEAAEWTLFGLSVVVVAWALSSGLRRHRNLRPALVIGLGLAAWAASLLHAFHPIPEEVTTVIAALTVAAGLIWNARLDCASGKAAPCGECAVSSVEEGAPGSATTPERIPSVTVAGATPMATARVPAPATAPAPGVSSGAQSAAEALRS